MANNIEAALVRLAYAAALIRDPDPAGFTGWVNALNVPGADADAIMKQIIDSTEGTHDLARLRTLISNLDQQILLLKGLVAQQ